MDVLKLTLIEIKPDVVALSEHKMSDSDLLRLNIDGYKICSYFSRKTTIGGGVIILCKSSLVLKNISCPKVNEIITEKKFECCFTLLRFNDFVLAVCCVYRTPKYDCEEPFLIKLEHFLSVLTKRYDNIIMVGDYNIDVLKNNSLLRRFKNVLNSFNFSYLVTFPTRVTESTASAIDNVVTNIRKNFVEVIGIVTELSDHDGQLIKLKNVKIDRKNTFSKKLCRNFNKQNVEALIWYLSKESWISVFQASVDLKYEVFHELFMYYIDLTCPKKFMTLKTTASNKWVSEEIKKEKRNIVKQSKICRLNPCTKAINTLKVMKKI